MDLKKLPSSLKDKAGKFFLDPTTMGTPAAALAIQLFDEECLEWDSVFLEEAIRTHLDVDIHPDVMQRLQAVTVLLASDQFFVSPEVFHVVCASLLDPDSAPEQMSSAPSPVELAWSCLEASLLLGRDYAASRFSPAVKRYCGVALLSEGVLRAPSVLSFADFPGDRYPEILAQDEVLAAAFEREQRTLLEDIESSLTVLKTLYRQQLASLAVFGGDQKVFAELAKEPKA